MWSLTNETHVHILLSRTVLIIAHVVHVRNVFCSYAKKMKVWILVKIEAFCTLIATAHNALCLTRDVIN